MDLGWVDLYLVITQHFLLCFNDIPRTASMVRPSLSTDFFGVSGDAVVRSGTTTRTTKRLVRIRKFLQMISYSAQHYRVTISLVKTSC